jgi:carbamoyl-phosphate synthase large subunit
MDFARGSHQRESQSGNNHYHRLNGPAITGLGVNECFYVEGLPFDKLPGADVLLGPEMRSTGEVMGIDYDFGRAYYKACISADNDLPIEGNVFISISDDQKDDIAPIARKFKQLGLYLYGTGGTIDFLNQIGIEASMLRKVQEGSPNVIDMMREGEII